MPLYGSKNPPAIYPGDQVTLFDAETLTAPQASIAVALAPDPTGAEATVAVAIQFASSPTAVVAIQTANNDAEADYVTDTSIESTDTSPDIFQAQIAAPFIRLLLVSQSAGGAITATVRRA